MSVGSPDISVLRLITRLNVGGPARQALLLTKELSDWPTVLATGTPPVEEGELSDPQVQVERVSLVRPVKPATDLKAYREVRTLLHRLSPKILHTHTAKAGMIGRTAARRRDVRTVHTFHGHVLEGYFRPAVQSTFLAIERRLARETDVLVAISPEVRDSLLDLGVGRPEQYRVIPLGFDLTSHLAVDRPSGALREHLGLSERTPLVGTVARLAPIKDLDTFVAAIGDLDGVHGVILGDGPERGSLEELVRARGLADRLHFTGWWSDIPAAMSDLDVVALTSLNEGTPVSLIEALACGRPIVATDVGGVRFVIEHGETGLLVAPGDALGLSREISALLTDNDRKSHFRAAGRALVRRRFHKDRLLADIAALYEELVGAPTGTSA